MSTWDDKPILLKRSLETEDGNTFQRIYYKRQVSTHTKKSSKQTMCLYIQKNELDCNKRWTSFTKKQKIEKQERNFTKKVRGLKYCSKCHVLLDRDVNAAKNILQRGYAMKQDCRLSVYTDTSV